MKLCRLLLLGACGLPLCAALINATGPYSNNEGSPTNLGSLGVGLNTISGVFDGSTAGWFEVTLPAADIVTAADFVPSNVSSSLGPFQATIADSNDSPLYALTPNSGTINVPLAEFNPDGTVELGVFTVFPGDSKTFDYTWNITAAAEVPEPSSAWLTLIGTAIIAAGLKARWGQREGSRRGFFVGLADRRYYHCSTLGLGRLAKMTQ